MTRSAKLALAAALALPWLFIWQGLDFTDQGYLLTIYRVFLHHPETVDDTAHLWLTDFIGAIWDSLFGGLGVLGQRGLWAGCLSLGLLVAFRTVRAVTTAEAAVLGVLVASAFISDRRETSFSYNTLTSVLYICAAGCLTRGITHRRALWLVAGGFLLGMNPFARVPNVLGFALGSAVLFAAVIDPSRRSRLVREIGATALGCACGAATVVIAICAMGHWQLYWTAVRNLFAPEVAATAHATHHLLELFVRDQSWAIAAGLLTCIGAAILVRVTRATSARTRFLLFLVAGALAVFVLTLKGEFWRWFVPGTAYFVLGAVAFGFLRCRIELRVTAWLSLIVLIVAPLGSDNGILNAHMGLWLALPLIIATLYTTEAGVGLARHARPLAMLAACVLGGAALHQTFTYTYRDRPRLELRFGIDDPQLRGQFTSAARAQVVGEVLVALHARVSPGDYLLAYEGAPLLQYLTATRPYLHRPWLMVDEDPAIARLLDGAPAQTGCLAVVVRTLSSARTFDWPEDMAHGLDAAEPHKRTRALVERFLRIHGYAVTWRNAFFEILEPRAAQQNASTQPCR